MLQTTHQVTATSRELLPAIPWVGLANTHWQTVLDGYANWNSKLAEALSAFQDEYAAFVNTRFQDGMTFPAKLAACKSPIDAATTYATFLTKAASDYQNGYTQLAKIGHALTVTGLSIAQDIQRPE